MEVTVRENDAHPSLRFAFIANLTNECVRVFVCSGNHIFVEPFHMLCQAIKIGKDCAAAHPEEAKLRENRASIICREIIASEEFRNLVHQRRLALSLDRKAATLHGHSRMDIRRLDRYG